MTVRDDALQELQDAMGSATARPVLPAGALERHLDRAARMDSNGLVPSAVGWVPTYDVNAAAAKAWGQKAALVAGDFNFSADGASYSKADVMAHCLEMEAKYAGRAGKGTSEVLGTNGPSRSWWDKGLIP